VTYDDLTDEELEQEIRRRGEARDDVETVIQRVDGDWFVGWRDTRFEGWFAQVLHAERRRAMLDFLRSDDLAP